MTYVRNATTRVLEKPGFAGIDYSDGAQLEERLLRALRSCSDLSCASAQLRSHITDWPSEYHLSAARHNLLRGVSLRPSDRILELGAGCGAITRFLGESGASVLAVEGSPRRAAIAAERCRDLPKVEVACDNLQTFETAQRFDVVTLIGVLEYSRRFMLGADPVLECLRKARAWLAEGGVLILAIENQLGLKYFAGCAEDHLDRPYAGIEGLYGKDTAVTFGRAELSSLLDAAGFAAQAWYYPFPDYKIPSVVVHHDAMALQEFDAPSLLFRARSRDYRPSSARAFDESLARRVAWKNGMLAATANSFLVLANAGAGAARGCRQLARAYNTSRHPQYCTAARFERNDAGAIAVNRSALFPDCPPAGAAPFAHRSVSEPYVPGPLLIEGLHRLARSGWSVEAVSAWAAPWVAFLQHAVRDGEAALLPGHFVDCTPFNCINGPQGIAYVDAEWHAAGAIPLAWVFIRGMAYSLGECMQPAESVESRRLVIMQVGGECGIELGDADFLRAEALEASLQAQCRPLTEQNGVLTPLFQAGVGAEHSVQHALDTAQRDAQAMRASRSWRLTRPLRASLERIRRLRG